mmetsp:Transcript_8793/g.21393  ORF Transcript_8793/g.21393 Transcript_8793/m.21393 type:complete len:206 (+) Transcript_8793:497-1114(+)
MIRRHVLDVFCELKQTPRDQVRALQNLNDALTPAILHVGQQIRKLRCEKLDLRHFRDVDVERGFFQLVQPGEDHLLQLVYCFVFGVFPHVVLRGRDRLRVLFHRFYRSQVVFLVRDVFEAFYHGERVRRPDQNPQRLVLVQQPLQLRTTNRTAHRVRVIHVHTLGREPGTRGLRNLADHVQRLLRSRHQSGHNLLPQTPESFREV